MSVTNGLALILYGDPLTDYRQTKGGTRSMHSRPAPPPPPEEGIAEDVKEFENFLAHCEFVLLAPQSGLTVALQRHDCFATATNKRPDATGLLPRVKVESWKTILSRYRFSVDDENNELLHQNVHWTLWLRKITLDAELPEYIEGENYITNIVCFPQSWLSWIDNEWFMNNFQDWYMQEGPDDTFGIPSLQSARDNERTCCAEGRCQFKLCNVPITSETKINEGQSQIDVSEVKLKSGYTDHTRGIRFPKEGLMYVILFDVPTKYKIARQDISNIRECVLCGEERLQSDLGIVFGACGHYICQECSHDYKQNLDAVTRCFYCRRPTSVRVDNVEVSPHEAPVVGASRPHSTISTEHAKMRQIMQRLQQL